MRDPSPKRERGRGEGPPLLDEARRNRCAPLVDGLPSPRPLPRLGPLPFGRGCRLAAGEEGPERRVDEIGAVLGGIVARREGPATQVGRPFGPGVERLVVPPHVAV